MNSVFGVFVVIVLPLSRPQLYLDSVQDLLVDYAVDNDMDCHLDPWRGVDLPIRESPSGVYVEGLTQHTAGSLVVCQSGGTHPIPMVHRMFGPYRDGV